MIISASRRSDVPAFYAPWFMNRIRAGWCSVPNPFHKTQVARVSLQPQDVDVIVFWTRNPRPLMPHLRELDGRGYRYYFQYTLMDNPRALDPKCPSAESALRVFEELADRIGPERVVWRYDPIVISNKTGFDFHVRAYERIARQLRHRTRRSVISIMDPYRKTQSRLRQLACDGIEISGLAGAVDGAGLGGLVRRLADAAYGNDMEIVSCAEELDLLPSGVAPGRCVDDVLIRRVYGLDVESRKDPAQRKACGCVVSRDIGMYDSCLFGCRYCYATSNFDRARANYDAHDPDSPSMLPV